MSIEIIKAVKAAEAEAELVKSQAGDKGRQIVAEARQRSVELSEDAVIKAESEAAQIIADAQSKAQEMVKELQSHVDNECSEIRQKAMDKLENAVRFITGRIVELNGDS